MKFSLIAALVVVLALAQRSQATDASNLERISQVFEDMKNKLTQELTETIRVQEMASQAQTFLDDKRTELEPLVTQLHDQVKTVVEEQMKPLAENMQAQIQPMVDNFQKQMEDILNKIMSQAQAIAN